MNFVSRLKEYLNSRGMSVTQFADTCDIPRPTMSQLLNGRNKKVSDELIGKIHLAYPDISVLWLMFGEGPMLASGYRKPVEESSVKHESHQSIQFDVIPDEVQPDEPTMPEESLFVGFEAPEINESKSTPEKPAASSNELESKKISFSEASASEKRIVSIIVYYSDNSYESFGPVPK